MPLLKSHDILFIYFLFIYLPLFIMLVTPLHLVIQTDYFFKKGYEKSMKIYKSCTFSG